MADKISDSTLERIASLQYDPGFIALIRMIDDYLVDYLLSLEDEKSPGEALRKVRFWQTCRKFVDILRSNPVGIAEELRVQGTKEDWETQLHWPEK